jgi:hypothetical protein
MLGVPLVILLSSNAPFIFRKTLCRLLLGTPTATLGVNLGISTEAPFATEDQETLNALLLISLT